ncbi:MAG: hypothetical protein M1301_04435 [Candidatus Thermoplasmatota archaeon]|jgi:hypothetical protein|nr:hypothetical protein [Candidatus Thermoplasmatota archaeon]
MPLTLLEVKDKIKEPLKEILETDDFRIVFAERRKDLSGETPWVLAINFTQKVASPKIGEEIYLPASVVITINDETGEITGISNVSSISKVHLK